MADGARISIYKVGDDGDPLEPRESRRKFINQCGVLVRDLVPIILEEWHKPKDDNKAASYVDDRRIFLLWDTLLTHVNLPPGLSEDKKDKVKQWTLKKMATQFQTWKKNLWKNYVAAEEQDPEFTGPLEKLQNDWPAFVKQRKSEAAVARSEINKVNDGKKTHHHTLGTGGYKTAVPKWEAFEAEQIGRASCRERVCLYV